MDTTTFLPDVPCQVVPRLAASSEDLRALGQALWDWSKAELQTEGLLRSIDNIVLLELMGGDDPTDVVFAVLHGEDDQEGLTITQLAPAHADPSDAARQLIVSCAFQGPTFSRQRAIQSLREAIPAHLVEDIVIEGRSWNLSP